MSSAVRLLSLVTDDPESAPTPVRPDFTSALTAAQTAEQRGQRTEARALYLRALMAMRTADDARQGSTICRWIARASVGEADLHEALDWLHVAVALAEAWGDEAAAGSAINVQAVVHWQMGALDEAERLYLTARTRALKAGDTKLAAMTAQNLGVIANVRGDLAEAQRHYEVGLREYRALGLMKDVAVALNNLGLLHTHQESWLDAERAFTEAITLADGLGDTVMRMLLDVNLAELWVARREYAQAQQCVRHALDLAARTGDALAVGQASKLLGVIARDTGDLVEAEAQFLRAEEAAITRSDVLLQAEVAREAGELARRQGRNSQVLRHLNRAHRLFSQLRARRDLADIDQRTGRLETEFLQVARRWGESIEAKDRYTQGHCVRVADLACSIAAQLGMPTQELFWFRIGALLHDVGKIVIPEEVLNKPGRLDEEEWALMRSHTTAGVEMLAGIEFPWDVLPMVRSHHERWDGKGYPDQLVGEEIPLVARILCVADVYDALTSVRSYKRALSHEQAVDLMRKDVGTMFDPRVFAAFDAVGPAWATRPITEGRVELPAAESASADTSAVPRDLDDLTHLPQRRAFRETAERILAARRTTGRPVSLLVIDVDHFKVVNDSYGHLQGDDVLRCVSNVLRANVRPDDYCARYAGDEFVILLPATTLDRAAAIAARIREQVAQAACPRRDGEGAPLRVTLSIGVATAPQHGETLDVLFAAADGALYASKRRGRDRVEVASGVRSGEDPSLHLDAFVGRSSERQRLRKSLAQAASGSLQVVSVIGEAGIGKSTLLRQLGPDIGLQSGALLTGRNLEADVRPPFGPWSDVLNALHELGHVPRRTWHELPRLVPALGAPGVSATDAGGDARASRYALLQEIREYITLATRDRLVVVLLDDMQWADAESWDVLELLAGSLTEARLLIGLTVRREDVRTEAAERLARLSRSAGFTEIALGRLPREDVAHWVRTVFGQDAAEDALVSHVVQTSEGNPLFAVQGVRALLDEHVVVWQDGQWRLDRSRVVRVPTAVRDLLARRIARLDNRTREVLTTAAVLGLHFDADTLLAASSHDEGTVLDALDEALNQQVLAVRAEGNSAGFVFTHALLVDVLVNGGNHLRTRRIHERVGQVLAAREVSDPADVARHFGEAGRHEEAVQYALHAADRARAVYADATARACLALAARHAKSPRHSADVEWRCAMLDELAGRFDAARQRCQLLLGALAEGTRQAGLWRDAQRLQLRIDLAHGAPPRQILSACDAQCAEARAQGDTRDLIPLLMLRSQVLSRLGEASEAVAAAQEGVTLANALDDDAFQADALVRLGSCVVHTHPADAVVHYRHALERFTVRQDRRGELRCRINIGVAFDRAGNYLSAEGAYLAAITLASELTLPDLAALAAMNLGVLWSKRGRFDDAQPQLEAAYAQYVALGHEPLRLTALYNLAHLARERTDLDGARELYDTVVQGTQPLELWDIQAGALAALGLIELTRGRHQDARAHLERARHVATNRATEFFQGSELLDALAFRLEWIDGVREQTAMRLMTRLEQLAAIDSYAAAWMAIACGDIYAAARHGEAQQLHERLCSQIRILGYDPLLRQLDSVRLRAA
ncbi:MAG: diguanylate cyclase [Gemmatimonadaceae bacterium]|nr:diguanylate cyclase [Gemmatimonadaceae bacterium]